MMTFQKNKIIIPLMVVLFALPGHFATACTQVSDCECGEQCVESEETGICQGDLGCKCLPGCAVGKIFIELGGHEPNAYGNICNCPPQQGDGTPACTLMPWRGLPSYFPLYQTNPKC